MGHSGPGEPDTRPGDANQPGNPAGRTRLTRTERKCQLSAKVCLYCSQAGHFLADCQDQRAKLFNTCRSVGKRFFFLLHLTLTGTFIWGRESVFVPFLVYSGADDSFISQDLAVQARIPVETLPEPRPMLGLNGKVFKWQK